MHVLSVSDQGPPSAHFTVLSLIRCGKRVLHSNQVVKHHARGFKT